MAMRNDLHRRSYWHSETTSLSQNSQALSNYGPRYISLHCNHVPRIIADHQRKRPRRLTLAATAVPRNPLATQQPIYWHGLPSTHFLLRTSNAMVSGIRHGALDRAKMAKPSPSKCGVPNVRVSVANGLTDLLDELPYAPALIIKWPMHCALDGCRRNLTTARNTNGDAQ